MIATKCPGKDRLHALSLGRMSDSQVDHLLEHIRDCQGCLADLETLQDAEDSLIVSLRAPDAWASLEDESQYKVALTRAIDSLAVAGGPSLTDDVAGPNLGNLSGCIGEYEIVRPLGRGGMGAVFLARHTKLGRAVALKVLADHRLADPRMRQRFEAEIRAVGRLSHPNIVAAHDAREVDGTAVLVTEYIDGFDLGQLIERVGCLGVADACEIARQVAVALAYTGAQGFVHRDVKPSNIMLSKCGEVKLLDLGLARLQQDGLEQTGAITGTGQAMGTADYVAPEQVTDSRGVDIRADIYALGCTLFKLLSGTAPFTGAEHATVFAKMTAHVSLPPPSLAQHTVDAPAGLVKLVDSMLAKDPAKRPQTPEAIAEALVPYCHRCNLQQLAERAAATQAKVAIRPIAEAQPGLHATQPKPQMQRSVPLYVAITAGLFAVLASFVAGVIITIIQPDGTKITLTPPQGSNVDIRATPAAVQPTPASIQTTAAAVLGRGHEASPLELAVVVEPEGLDLDLLKSAKLALQKRTGSGQLRTVLGTWYPVAPDVQVPIEAIHENQRYALLRNDDDGSISWHEIRGNIGFGSSPVHHRETGEHIRLKRLSFHFGGPLLQKTRQMVTNHSGRLVGFVIGGLLIATQEIDREFILEARTLEGAFPDDKIRRLAIAVRQAHDTKSQAADHIAGRIAGVWRLASENEVKIELSAPQTLIAFDGPLFHAIYDSVVPISGTYHSYAMAAQPIITLAAEHGDQTSDVGIYRFLKQDRLEILIYNPLTSEAPTGFQPSGRPTGARLLALERIGDVPKDQARMEALAKDKHA